MGRIAKAKKTVQKDEETFEKVDEKVLTLKNGEIHESNSPDHEIKEDLELNGDSKIKTNSKTTKSAKAKKESKAETKNAEPKVKPTKKSKELPPKEEVEAPIVQEPKKRVNKKKNEDTNDEVAPSNKRSKNGRVSEANENDKKDEKIEDEAQKAGSVEPVKKRGRKAPVSEPTKPDEPVKKRSKKDEKAVEAPVEKKEEKKKSVKGKGKATTVEDVETKEPEKPAPKRGKGKQSDNQELVTAPTSEESQKKPRGKAPKKDVVDKPEDKMEPNKKGKAKKETKAASESPKASKSPKEPVKAAKGRVTKKNETPTEGKKLLNSIESDYSIDFDIKEPYSLKITMWNLSGLRSCVEKGCVNYFKHENADIICLNELKVGSEKEIPEQMKLEGYHAYWNIEKGAPGVGILTKQMPMDVFYDLPGEFSGEKRLITAEFKRFFLVCTYVVNAGRGLKTLDKRLEWNKVFDAYIKDLDKRKPVIIAGDMNVAHTEIDLANPKSNQKNAGFTKEEREGFTQLLSYGFVDTFRHLYPDEKGAYTFWSYMNNARAKNVGWRLDYFITSERLADKVKDNVIRKTIKGSDHCPIVLFLDI